MEPIELESLNVEIPDRLYFKIGEVAKITELKEYVLRYWETEFNLIRPVKSAKGQRVYRKKDIESILLIKKLLYRDRYSIEGARRKIKELRKQGELAKEKSQAAGLPEKQVKDMKNLADDLKVLIKDCRGAGSSNPEQASLPF